MRMNNADIAWERFQSDDRFTQGEQMPLPATERGCATRRGHPVPLRGAVMSTLPSMRVEVNSELCQGHNRCYALAPELFDVDDYGNAVVHRRRQRCPPSSRTRPGWRSPTAPSTRSRSPRTDASDSMTQRPASTADQRLGDRLRSRRSRVQRQRPRDLGRAARRAGCPVAHSDRVRRDVGADHRTSSSHEVAYDTEHFTSNGVVVSNARPGDRRPASVRRTADHERPAVPPDRPPAAAAAVLARRRSSRGSPTCARCATSCSTASDDVAPGETVDRRRRAVRAEHPGQRDRPHARLPAEDEEIFRGFVHDVIEERRRSRRGARLPASTQLDEYLDAQIARAHRATRATTSPRYLLGVELDGNRLSPRARARVDRAAADRRHRHDVERDRLGSGTSPPPRRPAPGSVDEPDADDRPPSRSSCGPTPRSRWPGWSPRTTTSSTAAR